VSANALTGVRYISGPGENVGADAAALATKRGDAGVVDRRRGNQRRRAAARSAAAQAAVRRLSAINLDRGEILWQVAHGETPDSVRNHPALKGLTVSAHRTVGRGRRAGDQDAGDHGRSAATNVAPRGRGAMLRAYDKTTERSRRGVHAGAAVGYADDLRGQRPPVHRRPDQRRKLFGRVSRVCVAAMITTIKRFSAFLAISPVFSVDRRDDKEISCEES